MAVAAGVSLLVTTRLLERRDMKAKDLTGPNPFIDNASWRLWLKQAHEGALKYIADQKAKAAEPKASN